MVEKLEEGELTEAEAALHAEVDALGAPSEAGDEDVGDVADAVAAGAPVSVPVPVPVLSLIHI